MTGPDVLNEVITFPGVSSRPSKAQRESARTRFPPRPVVTDWPATGHDRGAVWERLTSGMFVLDNANSQDRRVRGLAWLLDWLADQPGQTWQQRWMASGADAPARRGETCRSPGSKRVVESHDGCAPSCRERWSWRSAAISSVPR